MIAFDGMGVYNENVQQYIVNNGCLLYTSDAADE